MAAQDAEIALRAGHDHHVDGPRDEQSLGADEFELDFLGHGLDPRLWLRRADSWAAELRPPRPPSCAPSPWPLRWCRPCRT
ncbi:MAG: hypothetical protein ACK5UV_01870, partial [bacterium]